LVDGEEMGSRELCLFTSLEVGKLSKAEGLSLILQGWCS